MSDAFTLCDPADARDFLGSFDARTRRKGEAYFNDGRVLKILPQNAGSEYVVSVRGSQIYEVNLDYEPADGWSGSCSCPVGFDCKHAYAAMKALLAENSVASVRGLSAGAGTKPVPAAARPGYGVRRTGQVADMAEAALGRRLSSAESGFVSRLGNVYRRCCVSRQISAWDFQELGIYLGGHGWETLHIWPSFPETEHEFWLYVANAAREHQVPIPKFLAPVTDLNLVRDRLARWQHAQEVERWKSLFGNFAAHGAVGAPTSRGQFDLRLALLADNAELQWKRPGAESFASLKNTEFHQFLEDFRQGRVEVPPQAEVLCQVFEARFLYGGSPRLHYQNSAELDLVSRVLRTRALENLVVTEEGEPVTRATEPLRWALTPPAEGNEHYGFRLVQADGAAPPPLLCTIAARPTLYVCSGVIFTGPPMMPGALDAAKENRIPAPAIESRAGLEFLQMLRVDLPQNLRDRIRHVPLHVAVDCRLQPSYPGSKTEQCVLHVTAQSPDGAHQEKWSGQNWVDTTPFQKKRRHQDDNDILTVFDRTALEEVAQLLEPLRLKCDPYSGHLGMRVTKKFPDTFVPWLKSLPPHLAVQLGGELASFAGAAVSGRVRLDVTETAIDWFDLSVVLDVSETDLTPEEIKLLLNARGGYVRLGQKGWRRLQFDLSEEEDERLARLGLNPHELTAEPQRLHALQLADESAKKFLPEQQVEQIQRRASEIKARVTPTLPAGVTGELRPYQLEGFHFLAYLATNRFGGILADDMGLGKTLQTLVWLLWLREQSQTSKPGIRPAPALVVCPKSVMDNWQAEAARFTPGLRVKAWAASELDQCLARLEEADIHVLNYSQLRILGESLTPVQWLTVILDEGQYIKNPGSQTAQVARALRAEHRLILSGTPIENRLLDLWSLMAFAMPGALGSRHQFARLYDAKGDPFARRRLSARVRPFLLRRAKSQVAKDLPDRVEEDLFCEIEGEQKLLYRAELKRAQQMLLRIQTQKQLAEERFHFLVSLLRLRQICCHPALVKPDSKAESAKLEALLEQLEPLMEEGHKVLVFSQFVELLALLKTALAERGWPLFYLAGETENRGKLVQEFQSAEGAAIFLISLKAGGFGLNLTAASYVVLFDPWWNPAVENQAIDRTHRIGQRNKVMAYRLLIKDSIEEKIRRLQTQKKALAEDVLGEEKFAQSLTLDDLQYLFSD
jgi:hypothetical protein